MEDKKVQRKAALYIRASDERSFETQVADLSRLVEERGWAVVELYSDNGSGGPKDRRPGLTRLLSAARTGRADVVVTPSLGTLCRSLAHTIKLAAELRVLNVDLVVLQHGVDTTQEGGAFVFATVEAIGSLKDEVTRSSVRSGVRRARASGKQPGRTSRATPEVVARARALRASGHSWSEITLMTGGVTSGRSIRRAIEKAEGKVTRPNAAGAQTSQ